jgi:diaminopimelate decarboxylase
MKSNLSIQNIEKVFQSALSKGLIREEDTAVIFHDLYFLEERIRYLKSVFPASALHGIATKANPLLKILEFMRPLGVGAEVASMGEFEIVLKAGYPAYKIVFDSPVKTMQELEYALSKGVHINADSLDELDRIGRLKEKIVSPGTIGIRINPQIGVGTILESSVAGEYSKFGIPIRYKKEELVSAFLNYTWLTGVHLHVGSQGCPVELLLEGIRVLYEFAEAVNTMTGHRRINIFDIGGGFPVSYDSSTEPPSIVAYANAIRDKFPELFTPHYSLFTEFGRWVHVNAGWTVSRIEYVKRDPEINTAMIHTGADLFLRECLNPTSWRHEYSLLDKAGKLKTGKDIHPYNLAGPLCFSGDILAHKVELPVVEEGDYLIIHDTGGYTFSMWSRYNSRLMPKVIGYRKEDNFFEILRERETFEDLLRFWE